MKRTPPHHAPATKKSRASTLCSHPSTYVRSGERRIKGILAAPTSAPSGQETTWTTALHVCVTDHEHGGTKRPALFTTKSSLKQNSAGKYYLFAECQLREAATVPGTTNVKTDTLTISVTDSSDKDVLYARVKVLTDGDVLWITSQQDQDCDDQL